MDGTPSPAAAFSAAEGTLLRVTDVAYDAAVDAPTSRSSHLHVEVHHGAGVPVTLCHPERT